MKKGNYAIYHGREYSADYIKGKGIVLRSCDKNDLQRGFQKYEGVNKDISYIKFVEKNQVSSFYKIRTYAIYQGYEFEVVEEKNNMISIVTMVGDYHEWIRLGMECIDRGVYQKWVNKNDAEIRIVEEYI